MSDCNLKAYCDVESEDLREYEVYAGGLVARRIGASVGGGNGVWWSSSKRWDCRRKILGFDGLFKTSISVIYKRDAWKDFSKVLDARNKLIKILKKHSEGQAIALVMEWGESVKEPKKDADFTIKSITPHFHILLERDCLEAIRSDLDHLVKESCFHPSYSAEAITTREAQVKARTYTCKRYKLSDKGKSGEPLITRKESKPHEMLDKWEGVLSHGSFKVHQYFNMKGRVTPKKTISITESVACAFGLPSWKYRNFLQMRVHEIMDKDIISIDSINFRCFSDLEKLILLKNAYEYAGMNSFVFQKLATFCPIYNNKEFVAVGVANSPQIAWSWFFQQIKNARLNGFKIPLKYDNSKNLLYTFDTWLNIKKAFYNDGELKELQEEDENLHLPELADFEFYYEEEKPAPLKKLESMT